jgi:hypothetical protein
MKTTAALVGLLAAVAVLVACTSTGSSTAYTFSPRYTPAPGLTVPAPMPTTMSSIPDGIYRTRVLRAALLDNDGNASNAGTWTLTVTPGAYTLSCQWTDQNGDNCGGDGVPGEVVVEAGPVRGDATRVWFAADETAIPAITGCSPVPDCGGPSPYVMDWRLIGDSLELTLFTGYGTMQGLPSYNYFTAHAWTKIG